MQAVGSRRRGFRFDPQDLLDAYIDFAAPATMAAMHRDLALRIRSDMDRNARTLRRMREACQPALTVLLVNILVWLISIANMPR